jgi:ATP-binding cassette subfamily F protein 3
LKNALLNYQGTFIIVSHDREFLDGLTNRIWDIENKGLKIHHFGVYDYLQWKTARKVETKTPEKPVEKPREVVEQKTSDSTIDLKEQKRKRNQLQQKISECEQKISEMENTVKTLEEELSKLDFSDSAKTTPVLKQFEEAKAKLDYYSEQWMKHNEELETIA